MAEQSSGFTDGATANKEAHKKYMRELTLLPAETVRAVAVDQLDRLEAAFQKAPYRSELFQRDYKDNARDIAAAKSQIAAGDALKDRTDDDFRIERRRCYTRAYSWAYGASETLARSLGNEDALVLLADGGVRLVGRVAQGTADAAGAVVDKTGQIVGAVVDKTGAVVGAVVDKTEQVVGAVAEKGSQVVGAVGGTVKTVLHIIAGGTAVAAVGYAVTRARQSAERRGG